MKSPVSLSCPRCGAPLPIDDRPTATCAYCGLTSQVRNATIVAPPAPSSPIAPLAPAPSPVPLAPLPSAPPAPRKAIVALGIVGALVGIATFAMISSSRSDEPPPRTAFSGAVPAFAQLPYLPKAPVLREVDRWMSTPARGADGTVAGLVHTPAAWAFVQIDEATGTPHWRTPLPGFLVSFAHGAGFARNEGGVPLPVVLEGGSQYLVAWQKEFALLDRTSGALQRKGTFAESVPAVSATLGACFVDGSFWVGVGSDFGVTLDPAGTVGAGSTPRPAACRGMSPYSTGSPMQNARDVARAYPAFCGNKSFHGADALRELEAGARGLWCSERRADDDPEHDVMLFEDKTLIVRDHGTWRNFWSADPQRGGFYGKNLGLELGGERVFLNVVASHDQVEATKPGAFQAEKRGNVDRSVLVAIGRGGTWLWGHTLAVGESGQGELLRAGLFASHPLSPTQSLYVLRPGELVALDQQTGAVRWQLGLANGDFLGIPFLEMKVGGSYPEYVGLVEKKRPELMACYASAAEREGPIGVGRVYVILKADKKGTLTTVEIVSSDLRSKEVGSCVQKAFGSLQFAPSVRAVQSVPVEVFYKMGK